MSDRGMMKWAPYKSLVEQATCLEQMRYQKNKIEKPIKTSDQIAKINAILTNYHDQTLLFKFFYDGYIYEISSKIKRIDFERKVLVLSDSELPMNMIIDIIDDSNFDVWQSSF